MAKTLKPSQNLYAQLLLLQVGAHAQVTNASPGTNQTARTTEDAGLREMARFLSEAGIAKGEVLMEDGSGLSRGTLLTPNATVKLLAHMNRHRHRQAFRDALPVAGVDGTLRRRMKGTPAAENARAKTGTLRYVFTLSGYVTSKGGDELAFSLMLNNYVGEEAEARAALDAIVVRLAEGETKDP
jgi:D-alanyl-D-alanine carboxypeptidase/D-alanyl-D-alanine-endopeptidase (penicillin-binding protein 4)